jgi:hypothetical protein
LAHDHRHGAQRSAQGKRADITHEHLRRVGVEPQEGKAGAGDGTAKKRSSRPLPAHRGSAGTWQKLSCKFKQHFLV